MTSNPPALPEAVIVAQPVQKRLLSIDALRGFDMFWIVGGEVCLKAWLDFSHRSAGYQPKDTSTWQAALQHQLDHCEWQGFRFYDLIFPLFLFIIGVVIPVSLRKHKSEGASTGSLLWRIAKRVILILALGLLYNHIQDFQFEKMRYPGVLQRLALGYGFAALCVVFLSVRSISILTLGLLVGYYFLLLLVPAPGELAGDITKEKNVAGYVDTLVFKHIMGGKIYQDFYGYGDNEGLLSTIPSFATALLGVLAGFWLMSQRTPFQKFLGLFWAGLVMLAFGAAWSGFFTYMPNLHDRIPVFPVIKNLWTSSYVLWAGGWSVLLLALFYGIIDGLGWKAWSWPLVVIGANAITIYLIDHFVDFMPLSKNLFGGIARKIAGWAHPLMTTDLSQGELAAILTKAILLTGTLLISWLLLWFLYRKKIFLRA